MSSDYLWDGSGEVDEDIRALEETLRGYGYQTVAVPKFAPKQTARKAIVVGSLAIAASAALWFSLRGVAPNILPEPSAAPESPLLAAGAASAAPPNQARAITSGAATLPGAPRQRVSADGVLNPRGSETPALDARAAENVVRSQRTTLHQRCFAPAMRKRGSGAPDSVRLFVRLSIAKSGRVNSVRTTGDEGGYKGLSNCVSSQARAWRFPVSKNGGTVQVPFVFRRSNDDDGLIEPFKDPPKPAAKTTDPINPWKDTTPSRRASAPAKDPFKNAAPPTKGQSSGVLNLWSEQTARPPPVTSRLSTTDIHRVVARERSSLQQSCFAGRASTDSAPTSARVALSITIAASGSVAKASATGGKAYPGLDACVAATARHWKFPKARGSTVVNIPFVFSSPNK